MNLVASCEQLRALDAALTHELRLSTQELMEIAGAGSFLLMRDLADRASRLVVACGPGQNGGDGYVVARYAASVGHEVQVFAIRAPAAGSAAAVQRARLAQFGLDAANDVEKLRTAIANPGVLVVDALFGTGLSVPLRPEGKLWIDTVASSSAAIVSIDLPSGLDGDSGEAPAGCVHAARTITIGAVKPGLLAPGGAKAAGDLRVVPLPYPPGLVRRITGAAGD